MPLPLRILSALCLLVCQACSHVAVRTHDVPLTSHEFHFEDGGMDPFEAYRLQMQRHGLGQALVDIDRLCSTPSDDVVAAERTCRYWIELQGIRHTDNLLALDMPVFLAMGEADTLVPIESAWFIRDRFASQGKTNLHLLTLPDTGHDFRRGRENLLPTIWFAFGRWVGN